MRVYYHDNEAPYVSVTGDSPFETPLVYVKLITGNWMMLIVRYRFNCDETCLHLPASMERDVGQETCVIPAPHQLATSFNLVPLK